MILRWPQLRPALRQDVTRRSRVTCQTFEDQSLDRCIDYRRGGRAPKRRSRVQQDPHRKLRADCAAG